MAYAIELKPSAARFLSTLAKNLQKRIATKIDALADNPRLPGAEKLKGEDDFYRVRVGDYRIIYEIHDTVLLVVVVRVGHRKEVYPRGLK